MNNLPDLSFLMRDDLLRDRTTLYEIGSRVAS